MEKHILLVDDEEGIRKILGIYLADMGYRVLTAEDGEQALKIFDAHSPPIVLTDIKMPGMDGVELLKQIKHRSPDAEVILITGHGDMDLAIKGFKHGAADFITKPINDDVLEFSLKRAGEKILMRRQIKEHTRNLEELVKKQAARLVETERLAAIGQAVEGLSFAISDVAGDLDGGLQYLNELPCFVSFHNQDLKVVAANRLYRERLGKDLGSDSWAIYQHENAADVSCPVEKTFEAGKGQRSKQILKYRDGNEVPVVVHTAPIRNQDKELVLVMEISFDIAEFQRLRDELRSTRQQYQQLFDEAPCYITVQDKDFKITAANRRFKDDFGDDIGSPCFKTYKHRDAQCKNCPVAKTFEDGKSHHSEMVVTAQSGDKYNVLIWTAPIYNEKGELDRVMEMSTNITQIRKLQDHLTSLGLLIGSISHGIKGILTALDGGMYLVSSGFSKQNPDQIEDGWEIVQMMIERIRKLVLDILYYAKERKLNWERTNVLTFARDVVLTVESKAEKNGVEFVRNFDTSLGEFEIDSGVVSSALVNILENAIDACVEDHSRESHQMVFGVTQNNGDIVFDVQDNGIGMDQETRENMFTLFFSSKGHRGTGLGLFISNTIIQQHGGTISVDSTPGEGSHFVIRMPKKKKTV